MMPSGNWLKDRAAELAASIAFCSRLPIPRSAPIAGEEIAKAAWAFPLAGLVVGLIGTVVYALAHRFGLPPWPCAALAVAATMLTTGCLHEDGLADTADGFGGGRTRELKLDIMRDSRTGVYGVCALAISLILRVSILASIASTSAVGWALLASHAGGRAAMPALMFLLPPARRDGLSSAAGRVPGESAAAALAIGFAVLAFCLHPVRGFVALLFLIAVIVVMTWLSSREIEGQTGDVLGALEQAGEIAVLLVALG
jgi:adenosylcobinamide-GDP ribazoletransferase